MHFVAALDTVSQMRGVLALFEGVATGAADGYARIAGRPAAVLLHLGPGLGNGLANLHNARRAQVPMVVVVGDHATYHKKYDAPLESDIDALAGSRVRVGAPDSVDSAAVATDTAEAIAQACRRLQIATLILPADASWSDGGQASQHVRARRGRPVTGARDRRGAAIGRADGDDGGRRRHPRARACRGRADSCGDGATLVCADLPTRLNAAPASRRIDRLAYFAEAVAGQLDGAKHWYWPAPNRRCPSSPTRTCPATWCRQVAKCTCSPGTAVRPTR